MLSFLAVSLVLSAAGPCDLLDRATAAQIIGAPVTRMDPSGPEPDEDNGANRTTCAYMAGQAMLLVIRLDFPSAAAANESLTAELDPAKLEEEQTTVKSESGPGDKAWVVYNPRAVEYVVLKGPTALTLALGGVKNPLPTYEDALRKEAAAITRKL